MLAGISRFQIFELIIRNKVDARIYPKASSDATSVTESRISYYRHVAELHHWCETAVNNGDSCSATTKADFHTHSCAGRQGNGNSLSSGSATRNKNG